MNLEAIKTYSRTLSEQLGLISVTIISAEEGKVIDYFSSNQDVDNQLAAAFQVEVLRQITRGLNYIDDLENKDIQNLMVSLEEQTHFAFFSDSKELIVHIIAGNRDTNISMVNLYHKKNSHLLN